MAKKSEAGQDALPLAVVVLDRGWVFVGRIENIDGSVKIHQAACVRRWGTDKGIGQLALEGPRPNTVIDEAGTVTVPNHAVIATIEAEVSKWPGR